ncbi:major facilitator superfamily domain-containing protein [Lipomyces kononenkoae]|uniref:Major facilitator superfamily domain-containing protein n=1 Tax=Lipomyces kononenkoae TaxID=34357 RepID=A0ACC3SXK8_LIPKO
MQSYIQYRNIGHVLRQQLGTDREKAIRCTDGPPSASPAGSLVAASQAEEAVASCPVDRVMTTKRHSSELSTMDYAFKGVQDPDDSALAGNKPEVFIVGWDCEGDPANPHNFSTARRVIATLIVAAIAFVVGMASSIDSTVLTQASADFGVSEVAESLATGIYLIGYSVGALFAGPFSETLGRNMVYIATLALFSIFIMGSALAPNFAAQLVFRFLAGFFGSTPLVCAGGSIADMWDPLEKTYGFPIFAVAGFGGPVLGPVVGSYIGVGHIGTWRWTEWISLITAGLVLTLVILFQPETYAPLILKWKARHLRQITCDARYKAELEVSHTSFWSRMRTALSRPFTMLLEPIIILMALYLTVLYIVLFTFLDGYTFIFADVYSISPGLANVIFVAMFVGIILASFLVLPLYRLTKKEMAKAMTTGGSHIEPEKRLWFAMLGGSLSIPISLFWMGWTDFASISIWSPIIASAMFGYGVICVFLSAYMYIIDSYEVYAASALAFVTLLRYACAGAMTVVGIPFYKNLGTHKTLTILACISAVLVPSPYVLYKWGYLIRQHSRHAITRK